MAHLNNEEITNVRQQANISEIISQYIPIEKKGRNFTAVCPFHEDTNPSLSISEEKQIFKCFVCGVGGNVFTFVSRYTNVSFVQAVKVVADYVNIPLTISVSEENIQVDSQYSTEYAIVNESMNYFHYKLVNDQSQDVFHYLSERQLTADEIEYFDIGYEENDSIINFLNKKGYTDEQLEQVNLININEYGKRSVFNNRLLFPIHNESGRAVGYSGRITNKNSQSAKYINSSESAIYTKGDIVYNYHRAKLALAQEDTVYLVEGVMDVIGFYKGNVKNVVATLGTAMTPVQARKIRKLGHKVVISYDDDNAGRMATLKAIALLIKENMTVEVLTGFAGLDPDDYIKEHGQDGFKDVLVKRESYLDFIVNYFKHKYNLNNFEERKQFTFDLTKYLGIINNGFDREYLINQIVSLTNFSEKQVLQLHKPEAKVSENRIPLVKQVSVSQDRAEFNIIGQMLTGKKATMYIRDNLGFLTNLNLNTIYLSLVDYYNYHDEILSDADLISLTSQEDEAVGELMLYLLNEDTVIKEYNKQIIDESIKSIQIKLIDDTIKRLRDQKFLDEEEQLALIEEISELQKQKHVLLGK